MAGHLALTALHLHDENCSSDLDSLSRKKSLFKAATNPSNLHLDIIRRGTDVINVDALEEKPLIHFDCPPERVLVFLTRY